MVRSVGADATRPPRVAWLKITSFEAKPARLDGE